MKDNTDPRRTHSAVCVTVQMSPAAQACSLRRKRYGYDTNRSAGSNSAIDWRQEKRGQRNCTEQSAGR
jgi:hypothetical protein